MKVGEKYYKSIWKDEGDHGSVHVIDQRRLPFSFEVMTLGSVADVYDAIRDMAVRGAPLIGAVAAWGVYLSFLEHVGRTVSSSDDQSASRDLLSPVRRDAERLKSARPTAVNLAWAVDYMTAVMKSYPDAGVLRKAAQGLCDEEEERSRMIGVHGLPLIEDISSKKHGDAVNILTHCNAGWLACVDYGTALAPVYLAHDNGIRVHVWVDETRPRNQGSRLTAWELVNHGVPCTLITDNAGGHLMQNGMVDIVLVGCDRATASGDVANKTGTYLKALAANDNGVPFWSALPASTFDLSVDRPGQIEIEERDADEVRTIDGVSIAPEGIAVSNYGFDVTPARLITGLITDRGICRAEKESILKMLS
ncbi:MAG: S-methyl-5-thioribose-1-phosphate isomerase [Bacteroidales bacterium]|nr:S-methyl-5-thioribose-1-phosphate isomerase [Bacteroidales bacterium]NLD62396.1 S-methyl-5-thioribose-1-phosphate isomerase [Bacteroidales bacterium]HOO67625.1 S-methyl-5-thioribose-1-phosphate isomerase [Bacteroidales bacterium]HPE23016.1 S-methyl-5-thioribose-1-phosphate isomerase [Bacteroidales bacterium]HPJ06234.1 S-methyl-5-thioribose-1-phosphate isomerase [Bacteroidales bacterium]